MARLQSGLSKIRLITTAAVICVGLGILIYGLCFTSAGSKILTDTVMSDYAGYGNFDYAAFEGNLGDGLTLRDVELDQVRHLPPGTTIRIQRLFLNITSFNINGAHVEAENVRLKLPGSEPIIIDGTFQDLQLNFNVYSRGFSVRELVAYLPDVKHLIPLNGSVSDIDIFITGHYLEPVVKGDAVIDDFIYQGFELTQAPFAFDLNIKSPKKDAQLFGSVHMEEGLLSTKRVQVRLGRSSLNFAGPWDQPGINLTGTARVEKTMINIALKGTVEKPELLLSSQPPQSQEKLMVMLATGKSWQSTEGAGESKVNSAALAKDFVDYFFLAGRSNQFARRFGISDFSVTFDRDQKGIAAKKEITNKLEIGYGIEKTQGNNLDDSTLQKLEGTYKINDQISVGVEREMQKKQSADVLTDEAGTKNDKVLLEYKTSF